MHCSKGLEEADRALLVEEENARVFCSEECISAYFAPEIARLEKQFFRSLSPSDLKSEEREKYAHLRWITLEEPDEVWREKTLTGDYRYTLISEFRPSNRKIWCVCITLCLRGEPSFLFIAFPTASAAMVNTYRRGERVEWVAKTATQPSHAAEADADEPLEDASGSLSSPKLDSLAHEWTDQEVRVAGLAQNRKKNDIPPEEFDAYQARVDQTLEAPDELWTIETQAPVGEAEESDGASELPPRTFHFIKYFADETPGFWYVIVARETAKADEIEILEAFPTRDPETVEKFRRGTSDLGQDSSTQSNRWVH